TASTSAPDRPRGSVPSPGTSTAGAAGSGGTIPAGNGRDVRIRHTVSTSLPRLVDPQQVPGGVPEGAVADAVRLVHRLLEDLAPGGTDLLEGGVDVVGGEDDAAQQALGEQLRHGL